MKRQSTPPLYILVALLGLVVGTGVLAYLWGTLGINSPLPTVPQATLIVREPRLNGTPVVRFARLDSAVYEALTVAESPYQGVIFQPFAPLQPIGAYLPLTGNTQFEVIPPTAMPTPLGYPTTPPLPLPALAGALPTLAPSNGRTLPYGGGGCAPSGMPVEGILTQRYHAYHLGIDIGVPLGTPVIATHSGTITYASWSDVGYGYLAIVQNDTFITYYAHNLSFNVVVGQQVGKGSIIAWSGSTGNSTGPHVHYEIRINDVPTNPLTFETLGFETC